MSSRILIACVGNIFLGDDGFGVAVAQRLLGRQCNKYAGFVEVIDFGIRGMDLASTLLDGYEVLVLVDAFPRGGQAGSLYLTESTAVGLDEDWNLKGNDLDFHRMDPVKVLAFASAFGARPIRTIFVGCEPDFSAHNQAGLGPQIGLSEPVQASVERAVEIIDRLCLQFVHERKPDHHG